MHNISLYMHKYYAQYLSVYMHIKICIIFSGNTSISLIIYCCSMLTFLVLFVKQAVPENLIPQTKQNNILFSLWQVKHVADISGTKNTFHNIFLL